MNKSKVQRLIKNIIVGSSFLLLFCNITGCQSNIEKNTTCTTESTCLNNKNDTGQHSQSSKITEISFQDCLKQLENHSSAIFYYGFTDCPWCKEALPIVEAIAEETDTQVYYVKTRDDNRNRLYSDKEKQEFIKYFGDYLDKNEEGELTIYVPMIARVVNGKVEQVHIGTVDSHDAHERKMTDAEKEETTKLIRNVIVP